ncbi:hypothetical protein THRCLA_23065 [Thraustotheca clavata]|uniref:Uncharacterized protein n=1 Tax=Thraustotheca clavata TaxID=74557 RepID=A0A1V9YG91_9STRA|nr:hypothetical protein THRCLA_23065 [Thraustotheca clavata]
MASILRDTVAHMAKSKKPLSDLNQIRQAIKTLQKDAEEQLTLEMESQATFAYLSSQLNALKHAFETLSDVEGIRKNTNKRLEYLEIEIERQRELAISASRELEQAKRSWEERDWAKDNEILKASHSHNIEWMQALQRDVMDTKDRVHELRHDHVNKAKHMADEAANLRILWQKQIDNVQTQLAAFETSAMTHSREITNYAKQRLDDLQMMEQAISTLSDHHTRLSQTFDDSLEHVHNELTVLSRKTDTIEEKQTTVSIHVEQLKVKVNQMERDQSTRMENITSMFSVYERLSFN